MCFAEGVNAKREHVGVCRHPNGHAEPPGEVIAQVKSRDAAEQGPIIVEDSVLVVAEGGKSDAETAEAGRPQRIDRRCDIGEQDI